MNKEQLKKVDKCVGQRLRNGRMLRDISQEELATAIGLTFQQVQKYENGSNRLSASRLYQIGKILNLKPGYFFEDLPEYEADDKLWFTAEHLKLIRYYDAAPEKVRIEFLRILKSVGKS